jgi:hypothetical protein
MQEVINRIEPTTAFFIKLGQAGGWEKECINNGTLRLDFKEFLHDDLIAGRYNIVRDYYKTRTSSQWVTIYENQIKNFYEADENVLWITFFHQKLWWCFALRQFKGDGTDLKLRYVKDSWRSTDIFGNELLVDNLSGQLLKTQGFQSTICNVEAFDYLVKKINGEEIQEVKQVKADIINLRNSISNLIVKLTPKDFEIFIDLIFRQTGYQRTNVIGGPQKNKDIELLSPVTGERILVQIKCSSTFNQYSEYEKYFLGMETYDRFFYVVHTTDKKLMDYVPDSKIKIWKLDTISDLTINAGLTSWLMNKIG